MANENWPIEVGKWYREAGGGGRLRRVDKIQRFASSGQVLIAYTWRETNDDELNGNSMPVAQFRQLCLPTAVEEKNFKEVPEELSIWIA